MNLILAFFTSTAIGRTLAKIGAFVLVVVSFGAWSRRSGMQAERAREAAEEIKALERGAKGAAEGRADLRKGKTPQQIKEANDAKWD